MTGCASVAATAAARSWTGLAPWDSGSAHLGSGGCRGHRRLLTARLVVAAQRGQGRGGRQVWERATRTGDGVERSQAGHSRVDPVRQRLLEGGGCGRVPIVRVHRTLGRSWRTGLGRVRPTAQIWGSSVQPLEGSVVSGFR